MTKHIYTEDQLRAAVQKSTSMRQLLLTLGLAAKGGNYKTVQKRLTAANIDTSHFTGLAWSRGKTIGSRIPVHRYLNNELPIGSDRLRKRLLRECILEPKCSSCGLTHWLDKAIPLELDHISGDNADNRITNLRLLCPNCHALTPTYRGRNQRRVRI